MLAVHAEVDPALEGAHLLSAEGLMPGIITVDTGETLFALLLSFHLINNNQLKYIHFDVVIAVAQLSRHDGSTIQAQKAIILF
jgi:hypothetical protein